jgi:hypothetical protein
MTELARKTLMLYRLMPGAPPIPHRDGAEMIGDVMGNAHWEFCETIVIMIMGAAQAYAR